MKKWKNCSNLATLIVFGTCLLPSVAEADVSVGDKAPLFESLDENMQPVNMADLIDGRPLVLAVGSAS